MTSGLARFSSASARRRPALIFASLALIAACGEPSGPRTGKLSLSISGLPTGTAGQVTLTGPSNFSRVVSATEVVANLKPGDYTITAAPVLNGKTRYSALAA